ncbi:MAG: winged helix DNA-binding domain-containing protein [Oscillospiraceae bacterium]|nr:winged helix DNA-binding domain-containing protein [Oscillospiraceae bacterium]
MQEIHLTIQQAQLFLLIKQGLLGEYRFEGKAGTLAYIRQAGCIQYDPVDVCGKNAELTLQSRVKGFKKEYLSDLLYKDRMLVDYTDKELSIFPVEDWPYFSEYRLNCYEYGRQFDGLAELEEKAAAYIRENGPVSADTLPIDGDIFWHSYIHWSGNWSKKSKAARSVLEQMFTDGRLIIHHKSGSRKFYDLSEKHIPQRILLAENPCADETEHIKWRIIRRIGAVGMLPDKRSDAFLGIPMTPEQRTIVFTELSAEGRIIPVTVDGIRFVLYILSEDTGIIEDVLSANLPTKQRCEFLAPLDPFLWNRRLIEMIFGFRYSWEIYTPADKRKYGYYVLPILYGDRFIGRIECIADYKGKILNVKNIWIENGVRHTKKMMNAIESSVRRFARFNMCSPDMENVLIR